MSTPLGDSMLRQFRSLIVVLFALLIVSPASAQNTPIARAILFYSPSCPHCHKVINDVLPPLVQKYNSTMAWAYAEEGFDPAEREVPPIIHLQGDVLQFLFIDTATTVGARLYENAIERFQIPQERLGVPTLIIGETVLVGSLEIPQQLPGLIDAGLEQGGLDWPDLPNLEPILASLVPLEETSPQATPSAEVTTAPTPDVPAEPLPDALPPLQSQTLSVRERILLDPVGNSLSILVLAGMLVSLIYAALRWLRPEATSSRRPAPWMILGLLVLGLAIAGYLSFVETSGTEAVCGPVGDCNTVQQSPYARFLGIPVGVLGMAGYAALIAAWAISRAAAEPWAPLASIAFLAMAFAGTAFSTYLTFLEPFVIGATCAWCLSSSVIMTALMLLALGPAKTAWRTLKAAATK